MYLGEEKGRAHLQVGHGHFIFHVVAGLLNGTEEVVEGANVDAGLTISAQHGVGFPTAWAGQGGAGRGDLVGWGSGQIQLCSQGQALPGWRGAWTASLAQGQLSEAAGTWVGSGAATSLVEFLNGAMGRGELVPEEGQGQRDIAVLAWPGLPLTCGAVGKDRGVVP